MIASPPRKLDRRTSEETLRAELAARQQDSEALVGALRHVARGIEYLAWSPGGDPRQIDNAARLRSIADRAERRWDAL